MRANKLLDSIVSDRTHGATELALIAIEGFSCVLSESEMSQTDELRSQAEHLLARLQSSRPSMSALHNLLQGLALSISGIGPGSAETFKEQIAKICADLIGRTRDIQLRTALAMVELIEPDDIIMTHSISSTLKKVFLQLSQRESSAELRFVVTESRPGDEGKLLATYLSEIGLKTTYITEAQIDLFMPEVTKVIVGADSVLADGSFINKCGTSLMAMSARYHSVPVYVCAESFKQTSDTKFELEKMDPAELNLDATGVEVSNIYFERISADLITQWINGDE